ncbi:MAG: hypothetical protein HY735_24605 [Verrucomicrobia bacterium]|nr:hypothetical protein [Verrucomicrobiota bacterium]
MRVASQLLRLGYALYSSEILRKLEPAFERDLDYWKLAFAAADAVKDADLMLHAGKRAYEIAPEDAAVLNNYAAALLVCRENPAEALRLTFLVRSRFPDSLIATLNHVEALLLNLRASEAEELLSTIDSTQLTPAEAASFHLNAFQTYCALGRKDEAAVANERIDSDHLYPAQRDWLDQARKQLQARAASGSR